MSCILEVATANSHGYYQGGHTYVFPAAVTYAYSNSYTPQGLKKMCAFIAKVGTDIVSGLDNPSIFQKYTNDLQTAVTVLNGNAADLVL